MKIKPLLCVCIVPLLMGGICAAQEALLKLKVVTEQANIRKDPDIGSPILHLAAQGSLLESEGKVGEWYRVRFISGQGREGTGFVHESLVIEMTPRPPRTEPAEKEATPPPKKEPEGTPPEKSPPVKPEVKEPPPPPPWEPPPDRSPGFSLPPIRVSLTGALSYRLIGDVNDGARGLADYLADFLESDPEDPVNPLHFLPEFGIEAQAELLPRLFLGLGLKYLAGSRESDIIFPDQAAATTYAARPEVRTIPLTLSAAYYVHPQVYLKGGLEYHLARCRYFYRFQQDESWEEWQGKASSRGWGLTAGVGAETAVSSQLFLFAELTGHWAKLDNFEGSNVYRDSDGEEVEEEGKLYLYQAQISQQISYPLLFIRNRPPTEADVSSPRLAELNLSGLALRVGLNFRF